MPGYASQRIMFSIQEKSLIRIGKESAESERRFYLVQFFPVGIS